SLYFDHQYCASVQTSRFFARVVVLRVLLAVAPRLETRGRDAARNQIVSDTGGAPLTERQIVLRRPDAAGMPFDDYVPRRVCLQPCHRVVQQTQCVRAQRGTIELEVDVLEVKRKYRRRPDDLNGHGI